MCLLYFSYYNLNHAKNLGGHRGPPKISEDSATYFRGERIAESIIIFIYN